MQIQSFGSAKWKHWLVYDWFDGDPTLLLRIGENTVSDQRAYQKNENLRGLSIKRCDRLDARFITCFDERFASWSMKAHEMGITTEI